MQLKKAPLALATSIVAVTILAMSGACSQHEPGDYQGGGRTEPTSQIGPVSGGGVGVDGSGPEEASKFDVITLPDIGLPDIITGPG